MKKTLTALACVIFLAIALIDFTPDRLAGQGTGTIGQLEQWRSTTSPFSAITTNQAGRNLYIPRSSATTSALTATTLCLTGDTCIETWPIGGSGGGSGFPVFVQNGGASLNTGTTTLNFTPNSFSLSENPADNFAIRISTTTLGLLTTNVGEGSNLYYTDTRARAAITENVTGLEFNTGVLGTTSGYFLPTTTRAANWDTAYSWGNHGSAGYLTSIATTTVRGMFSDTVDGLTYTSGTGVLSTDSGYVIPSTTRMTNADTAYSWGNHASQGYITDGNTNWDNSYGFITDGNSGWDNSYGFITDGNTGWDNTYGLITASTATATITDATSTNLAVTGRFSIFGTVATALSDLCTAITGGAGLCDGIDNTSSGAGSISTSTVPNTGELAYWTSPSTLSSVATGTLSESIDGVAFSASRGLIGGSAALSLDSGYAIPTTTRLVNHDTAFGWGNHASQGYITDGNTNWDNSYGFITSASVPARDWTQSGGYLVPTSSIGVNLSSHSVLSSYSATNGSTTNATSTNLAITGALKFFTQVWASLGDFVAYVRQQFSSSATGLTYNNSTGDLSLTAGYVIPTTTRAVNWDSAFGWGNHASQGYITDGNTGWDNTYGLITASTATATITNATTTNLRVGGNFSFGGVVGSAWSDFCTSITGSADLCDGSDATGGGGGSDVNWSWSSPNTYVSPATTTNGIIVRASSTIGAGTETGGLTISGGATTTGTHTFLSNIVANVPWNNTPSLPSTITPIGGDGSVLLWDSKQGSLVLGNRGVAITPASDIGNYSAAFGFDTFARNSGSFAIGEYSEADGYASFAGGYNHTKATGLSAFAFGTGAIASGVGAVAFASYNFASGTDAFSVGNHNIAGGESSDLYGAVVGGNYNEVYGDNSVILGGQTNVIQTTAPYAGIIGGIGNEVTGSEGIVLGGEYSRAAGTASFAMGRHLIASGTPSIVLGSGVSAANRLTNTTNNSLSIGFNSTIPTFVVTGGSGAGTFGSVGIGSTTPSRLLTVGGDIYTANITATGTATSSIIAATSGVNLFGGGLKTTANALCIQLTGSADLCDGVDDGGAGGDGVSNWQLGGTGYIRPTSTVGISVSASSTIDALTTRISTTTSATSSTFAVTGTFNFLGTIVTNVATWFSTQLNAVSTFVAAAASTWDFGDAGFVEIPNGTAPTANDPGEIAHDTTDNQLIVDDYVMARATEKIWGVSVASTSAAFINDALLKVPTELDGYTITAIRCSVSGGTSKIVAVEDESTNSTEDITCGASVTSDDGSITNATVTAGEEMYIDFGATSGTVDYVTITVYGQWTRE